MSADADPHYQKLYGRVTDVCSNRRGQPSPSAMKEPRPGRNPTMTRFASPSGKYGFQMGKISLAVVQNLEITCGPPPPPPPNTHTKKTPSPTGVTTHNAPLPSRRGSSCRIGIFFIASRPNGQV